MNKGSKAMYVGGVESGLCNTVYRVMVLMSLMFEVSKVYSTLYTGPLTPPRGKATAFRLVGLAVHQFEEAALLTFFELSN